MDKPSKLPFFAHFLEAQHLESVQAGRGISTTALEDSVVTLRYPSDSDGIETSVLRDDVAVTMKYPSDGDDTVIGVEF